MEKINITQLLDEHRHQDESFESWLATALLESFSQKYTAQEICDIDNPPHVLEVQLVINGKEVSFTDLVKCLHMTFDDQVKQTAKDVIYDAIGDRINAVKEQMRRLESSLVNAAKQAVRKK